MKQLPHGAFQNDLNIYANNIPLPRMKYLKLFLLLVTFGASAQRAIEPSKVSAFNIVINYPDYTVKTQILRDIKKITPKENMTYNWYASNQLKETRGGYDGKLLHGYYKCFYLSGNLKEAGEFNYGIKTGKWISWYPSGQIREVVYWKKGQKNGKYRLYAENSHMVAEGCFKEDLLDGKFKTYYNGKLEDVKKYKKGQEIIKAPKPPRENTTPSSGEKKPSMKERLFKKKSKTQDGTTQDKAPAKEESKKEKKLRKKKKDPQTKPAEPGK